MPYCMKCGNAVQPNHKFCNVCGTPIGQYNTASQTSRVTEYAGTLVKCPNCGETMPSFALTCPSCGHELRNVRATNSVQNLESQLREINRTRKPARDRMRVARVFLPMGLDDADKRQISLIGSFPIPNTKEDILEFMILASSNIDSYALAGQSQGNWSVEEFQRQSALSKAWWAKMEQAYQKAEASMGSASEFVQIKALYDEKKNEVSRIKKSGKRISVVVLAVVTVLLIGLIGASIGLLASANSRRQAREDELQAIVVEIEQDIADGNYDAARIKANQLYMDKNDSSSGAESWDQRRENILRIIDEAEERSK